MKSKTDPLDSHVHVQSNPIQSNLLELRVTVTIFSRLYLSWFSVFTILARNLRKSNMEQVKQFLELNKEEAESVSRLTIHPHRAGSQCSFYEDFALRGIRVDGVEPGFVSCTFKVPPRLTVSY